MSERFLPLPQPRALTRRTFMTAAGAMGISGLLLSNRANAQLGIVANIAVVVGLDLAKHLYDKLQDYMAGKVMGKVFTEPSITDAKVWIDGAVLSIESRLDVLEQRIQENRLRDMESTLAAICSQLAEYFSLPPSLYAANRAKLDSCSYHTAELLNMCEDYDQSLVLANTTMAHRLICQYALYKLDSVRGDASGHITSLVTSGELERYFGWAPKARARIVASMAPKELIKCYSTSNHGRSARCDVLERGTVVESTGGHSWDTAASEADARLREYKLAYHDLGKSGPVSAEVHRWKELNRKTGVAIYTGCELARTMYHGATGSQCPALLDTAKLELQNTSEINYTFDGQHEHRGGSWNP
jgi:hypothetical protein